VTRRHLFRVLIGTLSATVWPHTPPPLGMRWLEPGERMLTVADFRARQVEIEALLAFNRQLGERIADTGRALTLALDSLRQARSSGWRARTSC
jgi:hypothetical protein